MGNFEKLGILVIIVLVVVILVLAVWGMGVPPDPQDSGPVISANLNAGQESPKTVKIGGESAGKESVAKQTDPWLKQTPKTEPKPNGGTGGTVKSGTGGTNPQPKKETASGADLTHKVVKGDSPWALAEHYYGNGSKWKIIADANPDVDMNNLSLGKTLRIPNPDQVLTKKSGTTSVDTPRKATSTPRTYTVKKGDNLTGIARRTMGSEDDWRKLYNANRDAIGPDPDNLKLGMELVIP